MKNLLIIFFIVSILFSWSYSAPKLKYREKEITAIPEETLEEITDTEAEYNNNGNHFVSEEITSEEYIFETTQEGNENFQDDNIVFPKQNDNNDFPTPDENSGSPTQDDNNDFPAQDDNNDFPTQDESFSPQDSDNSLPTPTAGEAYNEPEKTQDETSLQNEDERRDLIRKEKKKNRKEKKSEEISVIIPVDLKSLHHLQIPLNSVLQNLANQESKLSHIDKIILLDYGRPENSFNSFLFLRQLIQKFNGIFGKNTSIHLSSHWTLETTSLFFVSYSTASFSQRLSHLLEEDFLETEYLLFIDPLLEFDPQFIDCLYWNLKHDFPESVAVSPLILDSYGSVYSAGISFEMGGLDWQMDSAVLPFHFLRGVDPRDKRIGWTKGIKAASLTFLMRTRALEDVEINQSYSTQMILIDIFLQIHESVYLTQSTSPKYHGSEYFDMDDLRQFNQVWKASLQAEIESVYESDIGVIWNMECGKGPVLGFTIEAMGVVESIVGRVRLALEINNFASCQNELLSIGVPHHQVERLERLSKYNIKENKHILIIHRDPGRYTHFLPNSYLSNKPIFIIGRSMFETDRIPEHWVYPGNELVDAIWVPSKFNVETFSKSGIQKEKLSTFPEAFNPYVYDPSWVDHFRDEIVDQENPENFFFLTIMKWEERKGWKNLLKGFYDAFPNGEKVTLLIRSSLTEADENGIFRWVQEYSAEHPSVILPKVDFLREPTPYNLLPSLYASVDAFVLPSHGEGWGLPLMEAMGMGLPVIGTNWSGNTEFMNNQNAFLVEVNELIGSFEAGHFWAEPSHTSLVDQFQNIYFDKENAKEVGQKARQFILENFSTTSIGNIFIQKMKQIEGQAEAILEQKKREEERRQLKEEERRGRFEIPIK